VLMLMLTAMMGAGCDYCIFILSRYREERCSGKEKGEAIGASVEFAGESILTSGLTVMIGFGVLGFRHHEHAPVMERAGIRHRHRSPGGAYLASGPAHAAWRPNVLAEQNGPGEKAAKTRPATLPGPPDLPSGAPG